MDIRETDILVRHRRGRDEAADPQTDHPLAAHIKHVRRARAEHGIPSSPRPPTSPRV